MLQKIKTFLKRGGGKLIVGVVGVFVLGCAWAACTQQLPI